MPTIAIPPFAQVILAVFGAYLVALWFSLVVWTFRDAQARTRDILAQILATLLVIAFNLPGLVIYLILRPKQTLAEAYERSLEEEYLLQDLTDRDICPSCRQRVHADFLLCPHCRTRLRKECPSCQRLLNLRWTICPYCGK